ncbi:transaldolase family protein [Streptomyces sp. NBC_01278]|uniref:transaldolase family protein n=1 Tax=Streptomyces sp. NBC_01278 TaxID=2903809 RepID=UPI003FCD1F5E
MEVGGSATATHSRATPPPSRATSRSGQGGSRRHHVRDPAYADTRYVDELVAPGVVNTMPEQTLRAVADHGHIQGDTIHGTYEASQQVLNDLETVGVSYADVVRVLEDEGIAKFTASGNELFEQLDAELHTTRTAT